MEPIYEIDINKIKYFIQTHITYHLDKSTYNLELTQEETKKLLYLLGMSYVYTDLEL